MKFVIFIRSENQIGTAKLI